MTEHIIYILEIFFACLLAEWFFRITDKLQNRKLDIGCDYCEETKKLYRTPDRKYELCRNCMEAYFDENSFTEKQKEKIRKKYVK